MSEIIPLPLDLEAESIIKVMGVGGGGGNAVNHMYKMGIKDVSFLVCNTDKIALGQSSVPSKLQLGPGLGAGGKPERARELARENRDRIHEALDDGTKMLFITAGMGGGTGTGASPIVAEVAQEMEILTVGIVTIPFAFEGKPKIRKALVGVAELAEHVDALLVINNEKLCKIFPDLDLPNAFDKSDDVVANAAKSIAEIITVRGKVNRDFNDVNTVMKNGGAAVVSIAKASGEKRILKAMSEAVNSPLIANMDKQRTKRLLYIVYSGQKNPAKMAELREINEFMEDFDENIEVLWGHYQDDTLEDEIKVAIVATGFDQMERSDEKGDDEQDEKKRLKLLCDKYYSDHYEEPAVKEEPESVPVVDNHVENQVEENIQESDEGDAVEVEQPVKTSFWDVFVRKLKVLMEEE